MKDILIRIMSERVPMQPTQADLQTSDGALTPDEIQRNALAEVFRRSPAFIAVLRGPHHIFELVNDQYLNLIGNRDVIGKSVREALPEVESQGFIKLLDGVYATGVPYVGKDVRVLLQRTPTEPPEERFLDFVYQVTSDADNSITGILAHGIDVTNRKHSEDSARELAITLERQSRIFNIALSHITDFTYIFDLDCRFLYANPALLNLWGLSLEQAVGKNFDDLKYPADLADRLHNQIRQVINTRTQVRDETPYTSPSGATGFYEYIFSPVLSAAGKVEAVVGSTRDISQRRQSELDREQSLASERAARADAERASRMKDDFLATLSHELRTPLNAILGWSQILRKSGASISADDLDEGIVAIERNARAQTQIIEDLLDMSRIVSGKVRLDVQSVDLATVVRAGVDTMRPAAEAKGVRLDLASDATPIAVSGDPNRLHQVFWNLVSNAIKFTPRGGSVRVTLQNDGAHIEVNVIDTGEGITTEFLPHVFDRFRQADASTTRRHGGLGLGLSIVKQLVELHGGSVMARSDGAGKGTTFTVILPIMVAQTEPDPGVTGEDRLSTSSPNCLSASAPQLEGVRILVVDDEADTRAIFRRLLEDCGARVRTASSAAEAFDAFTAEPPDVLISDIGMPVEDGYSLMRRIRELDKELGGNTPALALTAYARPEDRLRAVRAGFQMHLVKPVEPHELITMAASLVQRTVE